MSTVFTKLCLRDFLRRKFSSVPKDAPDGEPIPEVTEKTPLIPSASDELVWYFVCSSVIWLIYGRLTDLIYRMTHFSNDDSRSR
jgi:hypothetical protein